MQLDTTTSCTREILEVVELVIYLVFVFVLLANGKFSSLLSFDRNGQIPWGVWHATKTQSLTKWIYVSKEIGCVNKTQNSSYPVLSTLILDRFNIFLYFCERTSLETIIEQYSIFVNTLSTLWF